jgi:hypothetical protein
LEWLLIACGFLRLLLIGCCLLLLLRTLCHHLLYLFKLFADSVAARM